MIKLVSIVAAAILLVHVGLRGSIASNEIERIGQAFDDAIRPLTELPIYIAGDADNHIPTLRDEWDNMGLSERAKVIILWLIEYF